MFTDIVGYSAITQRDEALALSLLDEHNRILREVIAAHGGTVVKTVGDAFLAEFASALDAVKAAMAIQTSLRSRNSSGGGEFIRLRIGIHLGDVIFREGDVFGDGVNIAARIQSIAEADGICLSGDVAGQVGNKIGVPLIELGTPKLKNIDRPIPVFGVQMPWMADAKVPAQPSAKTASAPAWWRSRWIAALAFTAGVLLVWFVGERAGWFKSQVNASGGQASAAQPSLAVLPFADLSEARDQEYLGDGLAEEILNQLAQSPALRLVGRTSSFSFKGKNEDPRLIGQKLGVAHLLEGSVRKDGAQLRITAQLIRADDGTNLWSKSYARELRDVFAVQDEIARDVATALSVRLEVGDLTRVAGGTANVAAYEKFLQARATQANGARSAIEASTQLFREAVALDPDFGVAWVALVQNLYDIVSWSAAHNLTASKEIAEILARNVRRAPDAPWTLHLQAYDHLANYRWGEAEAAVQAVLKTPYGSRRTVDPWANPPIYLKWAWLFNVGRAAEAVNLADQWARADPLSLYAASSFLQQLPYASRDQEMSAEYARSRNLTSRNNWVERSKLNQLLRAKAVDLDAIRAQFLAIGVDKYPESMEKKLLDSLGDELALRKVLREELDKPDAERSPRSIVIYADGFGERELALTALERNVLQPARRGPAQLQFLLWYPYKSALRADPRFKDIIRKLGLVEHWRKTGNWGDFCKPLGKDDFECR